MIYYDVRCAIFRDNKMSTATRRSMFSFKFTLRPNKTMILQSKTVFNMIRNFHSNCSSIQSIISCYLCKRGLLSDRIIGKGRINSLMMGWSENCKCNYSNVNITRAYVNMRIKHTYTSLCHHTFLSGKGLTFSHYY